MFSLKRWWVWPVIFLFIAGFYWYIIYIFVYPRFNITKYESILTDKLSGIRMNDTLTDEVYITSYSYNDETPRFYTKRNSLLDADYFDL